MERDVATINKIYRNEAEDYKVFYSFLSFLRGPRKAAFSAWVWNLPWPNLEVVSMNLRLIFSRALFLVWVRRDFLRVRVLFLGPMQQPFTGVS